MTNVVLADVVEPLLEPPDLMHGKYFSAGPDVTGQGVEFRMVGQDDHEP
ncbi:hypothetical protein ACPMJQ_28525 [Streptomyces pseudogriseolus]